MSRSAKRAARRQSPAKPEAVGAWRRHLVLGVLGLSALRVAGRAFQLQVIDRDYLTRKGAERQVRTVALPGHRAAIRDRRGEPLALSAPVDSLWCVPSELLGAPEHMEALAKVLGQSRTDLDTFLKARAQRQFVYLERGMPPDEARRALAIKAPGVFSIREYRRYYPAGEVTGQLVGFTNVDGQGQEGMEMAYDETLSGTAGSRRVIRDARGRIVEDTDEAVDAQPGQELRLSIDLRLQYLAYRELKGAVARHQAKGGLLLVADARNGEILAMASQPGFNPNKLAERRPELMRNRPIVDTFEPGSVVKPLLVAQAIETGVLDPNAHIETGDGWMMVKRLTVQDVHALGTANVTDILAHSSNVGAAKIGLKMGPESVWQGYQRFGFGERVAVNFPGEASPVLRHYMRWGEIATATASYGYGLSLNAMHLVRAYAGLANDGMMPQLKLTAQGNPGELRRAIGPATARRVRHMLESVTADGGTGSQAAIPGYRVAGKTGTVRKVAKTGGYAENRHQSVFIGMVPADRPRLVGLVMIDEPRKGGYYGGVVAAPVFSSVLQGALRLLQIAPDDCAQECARPENGAQVAMPQTVPVPSEPRS